MSGYTWFDGQWRRYGPRTLVEAAQLHGATTIYPFTDAPGSTTVTDLGDNAQAGSTYGSGLILQGETPPGNLEGVCDFPGTATSQYISSASYSNDDTQNGTPPWTLEAVLRIDGPGTVGDGQYVTIAGYNASYRYLVTADVSTGGALLLQSSLGDVSTVADVFPRGSWFHMAHTFIGDTQNKLFINGVEIAMSDPSGKTLNCTFRNIGSYVATANYMFNGAMAFYALYGVALTPEKVLQHFKLTGL